MEIRMRKQDIRDLDPAELLIRLFDNAKHTRWTRIKWLQYGFNPLGPAENTQRIMQEIRQEEPNIDAELSALADNAEVIASVRELSFPYVDAQRVVAGNGHFQVKDLGPVFIGAIFLNDTQEVDATPYDIMYRRTGIKSSDDIIAEMRAELRARNQTNVTSVQPSMMSKIGGRLWTAPSQEPSTMSTAVTDEPSKTCAMQ